MSHMRELGAALKAKTSEDQKLEERLQAELGLTELELQQLFAGRLLLTGRQLCGAAAVCGVAPAALLHSARACYPHEAEKQVHCMTPFSDPKNREEMLDMIDAYIDAREALFRAEQGQ